MLAAVLVYSGSFSGPFVFDDVPAIAENPSIRPPWSLARILHPEIDGGTTVGGRPLLNLSFALNQAISGEAVWSYHAANLAIHLGAGLLLFGVVRRTLAALGWPAEAPGLAAGAAALWLLHPLQTAAVTYVVQRAESLAGFWYLLALYGFVRGATDPRGNRWLGLSVAAGLLGGATKETLVTAPIVVLLLDRTFFAGSWREAWARRKHYYLALALTWVEVGFLVAGGAGRGGTAGFGAGVSAWQYALTQCRAHLLYLRLVLWPGGLVFDHGTATVGRLGEVWPQALVLAVLVGATGWALVRRPVWGFAGAAYLLLLAPTSSFVPVASQTIAEHRMYLPLALPAVLATAGLYRLMGRGAYAALAVLALACGARTLVRNADYRSAVRLWSDTVAKVPANPRAQHELGKALFAAGRAGEAAACFQESIALDPRRPDVHFDAGVALAALGNRPAAIAAYTEALRLRPDFADALNNLGVLQLDDNRPAEAAESFNRAVRAAPNVAMSHHNLASALLQLGNPVGAIAEATEAARLDPADVEAYVNWGNALAAIRQPAEAMEKYAAALQLRPDYPEVHNNLANLLAQAGRGEEAVPHYREALRLRPDYAHPRLNLTRLLLQLHRPDEAIALLEALAQAQPGDPAIPAELARVRAAVP